MRYKKIIVNALCIVLVTVSFGGIITSYAKNDTKSSAMNETLKTDEMQTSKAPDPYITDLEPEFTYTEDQQDKDKMTEVQSTSQEQNNGTVSIINSGDIKSADVATDATSDNPKSGDIYNFDADDIDRLLQEGHSVMDIIEADEIGNQLNINPMDLLKLKKENNKSLDSIKEDILKDRKDKGKEYLKNKYPDAYKKLKDKNLSDDEISIFFGEMNSNDMQLTDDLITGYVEKGKKVFQDQKESKDNIDDKGKGEGTEDEKTSN